VLPDPGTTRDALDAIVEFQGNTLRFIDTAGLRKQRKVRQSVEYYSTLRSERAIREATVSVLVIDATEGISSQDKKIAWTITEARRGLIIAANKWDLMKLQNRKESDFVEEIHYRFPHAAFAEVIPISAKNGYNTRRLLKNIVKVYNNYHSTIQTSDLNSFIRGLRPGASEIKYGYQRGSAPPRFEFFVRNTDTDDTGFKRYLANSLRKGFDLSGVPLEISLRKR
jgi:GTP-binding protein